MKRTDIAAIDVGSTKVCTIIADRSDTGELRMLGYGTAQSQGPDGMDDTSYATASIAKSVKQAQKMAGRRLNSAYVAVPVTEMTSLNNSGIISVPHDNMRVHSSDRKRALEVAQSVEVPSDRRLLHVIPRSYTLDGQGNIKNPVGMHGFRLHVDTHIVTVSATLVQNLTRCLTSLGIGIDGLVLESLASAEAVLTEDERQNGVVLADIGGADTGIAVFKGGNVYHTAAVPVGGNHITNDIAVGLGLPFELAEEAKKKHGNAIVPPELAPLEISLKGSEHSISRYELCEIINARVEELIRLILLQLPWDNLAKVTPAGLVLTGGSSRLPSIAQLAGVVSRLPVRVGRPVNVDSSGEALQDPVFATGVGLLYWKMRNEGSQDLSTSRGGLQVLLPRWLGYFGGRRLEAPVTSERR